ncbi:hypothetical protein GMPD_03090 [Geomonas paludis]|uniref:Uncharacterized protein n=1 Tax=Geomonas paludis TaxID=2740185 RepID=A0A6V8MQQ6_9BACT|nr:hypothetical protein GMPD_03090 [Geomonas paludis]
MAITALGNALTLTLSQRERGCGRMADGIKKDNGITGTGLKGGPFFVVSRVHYRRETFSQ